MAKASKVSVKNLRVLVEILDRIKRIEKKLEIDAEYKPVVGRSRADMKAKAKAKTKSKAKSKEKPAEKKA